MWFAAAVAASAVLLLVCLFSLFPGIQDRVTGLLNEPLQHKFPCGLVARPPRYWRAQGSLCVLRSLRGTYSSTLSVTTQPTAFLSFAPLAEVQESGQLRVAGEDVSFVGTYSGATCWIRVYVPSHKVFIEFTGSRADWEHWRGVLTRAYWHRE